MSEENTEAQVIAEQGKKKSSGLTNALIICMAAIFSAMAAVMIFVPGAEIIYLCYAVCAAVVVVGIYQIVRYFMTDAYKNLNAYGFSSGTLLVILAICGFLKAGVLAEAFLTVLGVIILLSAIIVLQHSMDLRRMRDPVWIAVIIISFLMLICSVIIILQPMADSFSYETWVWWALLVCAGLTLIINIYMIIRVSVYNKKAEKKADAADTAEASVPAAVEAAENTSASVKEAEPSGRTDAAAQDAAADGSLNAAEAAGTKEDN